MIPVAGVAVAWLIEEVRNLETDLDVALQLISQLTVHLRPILGEQALGPALRSLAEAEAANQAAELQGQIDALVARGDKPGALRQLRELTRLTWDEVYSLRSGWGSLPVAEKRRSVRRMLFRRVLQASLASQEQNRPESARITQS
jgi:hypothetical protein